MTLLNKPDIEIAPSKELEDELTRMFNGAASGGHKRLKGPMGPSQKEPEYDAKRHLGVIDKKLTEEEE